MSELPPLHRETLTLRFAEEMKLEQIAGTAGVPPATVKSRLRRGLEALRRKIRRPNTRVSASCWRWAPAARSRGRLRGLRGRASLLAGLGRQARGVAGSAGQGCGGRPPWDKAGLFTLFAVVCKPGEPPFWFRVYMGLIVPAPLSIFALVAAYIHADAKRRAMRHVMWTWLAVLIPNGIGVILYFIFREPLMRPCSNCGLKAKQTFAFCPGCGATLQPACPGCRKAVEPGWANCPYCGGRLAAA